MSSKDNLIWVEKYRPNNINKVIQQDEIKQLIFSKNKLDDLPHLLLYGPPGTGKTTTALAICKYIFLNFQDNPNNIIHSNKIIKERILELNASDERGIKVVREKIKIFASQALNNYTNIPNFKIIILDEADVMTNDSQFALRRIMEQYSHITRFILICNYITKIIPPLTSRCSKYRFNTINLHSMKIILKNILIQENVNYKDDNIDDIITNIYNYSNGDLRKAITLLQRSAYVSNINRECISLDVINELSGLIPRKLINNLYELLLIEHKDYLNLTNIINMILHNGYSSKDILNDLSQIILYDKNINDKNKSLIYIKMSEISNLLASGSGDFIQILALCTYINNIFILEK